MDMNRYRELFLTESRKHLEAAEELLLRDEGPGREALDSLFREIHSLKGMAASMGFGAMAELAHRLEDLLERRRGSGERLARPEVDLCLRVCDRLAEMRERLSEDGGGDVEWADLASELASAEPLAAPGAAAVKARIALSPDCGSPAARAFLILRRFKELDPALLSVPSEREILQGAPVSDLRLTFQDLTREDVETLYRSLTEVASLSFEDGRTESQRPSPEPSAAPASAASRFESKDPEDRQEEDARVRLPETVQAPVRILDEFVDLVGEMTISRSHLVDAARAAGSEILREELNRLGGLIRGFHERVMALRMLPFSLAVGGLKRVVRDVSARLGKDVDLKISGEEIGMDKSILLQISDPLVHLLRNALDHGLEAPEERRRRGKPARGTIEIRVGRAKNRVEVTVADDGGGIDVEAVRRKAVAQNLFSEEESLRLSSREVLACLFRPGFSTRESVSDLSGRGVGLDVVKTKVDALGGAIEVVSTPGAGTEIRLSLPQSVAIVPVLMVRVGSSTLALPVASVLRTVEALPSDVRKREGQHVLLTEQGQIPILSLARIVRIQGRQKFDRMPLVLLQASGGVTALAVDRLVREEDLFIKPLRGPLRALPGLAGYSVLGDGSLVFLLDPATLLT